MKKNQSLAVVLTAILLCFWASAFVGIRHALERFSPVNLAFLRYLVASACFVIIAFFQKFKIPTLKDVFGLTILGLFGFVFYNLLLNWGEQKVDASIASFIVNLSPFISVVLVSIQKTEQLSRKDWFCFLLSLIGLSIIIFSQNNHFSVEISALLVFGAAMSQAIYFVLQKRFTQRFSPLEITSYAVWSATFILFFFAEKPFYAIQHTDTKHILSLIYLGVFPGAAAYLALSVLLHKYQVSNVTSYMFLVPFITLLLGFFFMDETPSMISLLGGLIIILSILFKNDIIFKNTLKSL